MRTITSVVGLIMLAVCAAIGIGVGGDTAAKPEWSLNATLIEACSCPMFCQCYFNTKPAAHGHGHGHGEEEHFCRFNNVFRVNHGKYGDVSLDGMEYWVAGDLGGDFSEGQMDWAVLIFEPEATPGQREGVQTILGHLYPVEWESFTLGEDAPIEWKATKDHAVARLAGGKGGEVILNRFSGMSDDPVVIHNLKYWGAPRNEGFVLMPNEVEAFKIGEKAFEYKGGNGFMITLDMTSKDLE